MKQIKKLQLNKEIVAKLKKEETQNIFGGQIITVILTQGPGCRTRSMQCQIVSKDQNYTNPMTSYCTTGFVSTCQGQSCGTDIWC